VPTNTYRHNWRLDSGGGHGAKGAFAHPTGSVSWNRCTSDPTRAAGAAAGFAVAGVFGLFKILHVKYHDPVKRWPDSPAAN
jgi:hypothetical protein